jgi:MOSC domain-containing protein YiiM
MRVVSVSAAAGHRFSKQVVPAIELVAGEGVAGDAHRGVTVKHRSRVAVDPSQPNLRQVHLIHAELFDDPEVAPFALRPGDIGENILTEGIPLLDLPRGTRLSIGGTEIEITGLRNPCAQLDAFRPGLTRAMLGRDAEGGLIRKAGVMGIVGRGGVIRAGDAIMIRLPPLPHEKLERV